VIDGNPYREILVDVVEPRRTRQDRYAIALRQIRRALKRPFLTRRAYERLRRLESRAEKRSEGSTAGILWGRW
jgi:hypothetical protein